MIVVGPYRGAQPDKDGFIVAATILSLCVLGMVLLVAIAGRGGRDK
jgi:hypothetical protein